MFIGSYSKTLLNSTTNLSTPIHSYFPSTLRSILSLAASTGFGFTHLSPPPRCSPPPTATVDS